MPSSELNSFVGRLDRIISEMKIWSKVYDSLDDADQQTVKHHAEDMMAMGNHVLRKIESAKE